MESSSGKLALAYRSGDLAYIQKSLGHLPNFPNCRQPFELGVGTFPLEFAIFWSPMTLIEQLLEMGADSNYPYPGGFPSLIAALLSGRPDRHSILKLLISQGVDVSQRGLNDWTPLHCAVSRIELIGVAILLENEANPYVRTRIGACTTPIEDAEKSGFTDAYDLLRRSARLAVVPDAES